MSAEPTPPQPPRPPTPPELIHPPAPPTPTTEDAAEDVTAEVLPSPIPPPDAPFQYRAIGLVEGYYLPAADQFNRGILQTTDGTTLDAVLLGRVMSLVRKHLESNTPYLWVVYPRTRDDKEGTSPKSAPPPSESEPDDDASSSPLHVQIVGVWAPEVTGRPTAPTPVPSNYFSIRGEVVYQSYEHEYIIVKIRQAPRATTKTRQQKVRRPNAFRLRLEGKISGKAVNLFWDLTVERQTTRLVIVEGSVVGPIPRRRPRRPFKSTQKPAIAPEPSTKPPRPIPRSARQD